MNATTQNFLIEKWGKETKDWIGKDVELAIKQILEKNKINFFK